MNLSPLVHNKLKRQQWIRMLAFFGVIGFTLIILVKVENMMVAWLIAFVISYLLDPSVNRLERAGVHRILAIGIAFFLITVGFVIVASGLSPLITKQFAAFQAEMPKYIEGVTRYFNNADIRISETFGTLVNINLSEQVNVNLVSWTKSIFEDVPTIVSKSLTTILLAPFFAFFMLKDGKNIFKSLLVLVPNHLFEPSLSLFHQINSQMGQFIRARLLEALLVGCVVYAGLFAIDFPFASILALFAALTNLIPYVGPIIGAIPAIIIALINGATNLDLLFVTGTYFIAQLIDALVLIPMVVAKIVDLHPVTVVISIIIGAQLMGVLGMLISIPVASVIKVTLGTIYLHMTDFRT